ncbi:D-tyrosyl-tRNA(Tyr) deacylase [bacterium]|nr:D-tyrosyl-tRNA(Tyr) deacylase [bacterium]
MRSVVQRVQRAEVRVGGETVAAIGPGFLVLTGVFDYDGDGDLEWMARRIAQLRIFADDEGRMNLGPTDVGADILLVSQFTLCANIKKGNRPSFMPAMAPEPAAEMVQRLACALAERGLAVRTGMFGAMMEVELVNDGPVTIVLDSREFR